MRGKIVNNAVNNAQICPQTMSFISYVVGGNSWEPVAWRIKSEFLCTSQKGSMIWSLFVFIFPSHHLPSPAVSAPHLRPCTHSSLLWCCSPATPVVMTSMVWVGLTPPPTSRAVPCPAPGLRKYEIPSTMGIGWRRVGASSWANKNQPALLQGLVGSGAKLVGCMSGPARGQVAPEGRSPGKYELRKKGGLRDRWLQSHSGILGVPGALEVR